MHWFYDPNSSARSEQLPEAEVRHLASLRVRPGDKIVITNGKGDASVFELLDPKSGSLRFVDTPPINQPAVKFHLVQALAKGDRDEMALQAAVELGIASATPWQAEHSVANWRGKEERARGRWQQIAVSAMKQSQQAILAEVGALATTGELKPKGQGILLIPNAPRSIVSAPVEAKEFTIVVGPEGGITDSERSALEEAGFVSYRLGSSVLRTSSAGPAAIAALSALSGAWSVE